ncbi:MAG: NAD-dependent epimerase/dehydratase family protein [Methanomicrobiales archaeon]|nr:NAD-dependent epimerase/dehydratase family protein [Methanomicrobiales archaeon]
MNKRYLITGGAGFIGSHLCRALVAGGNQVVILDSLDSGRLSNIEDLLNDDKVEFIQDTILNESRVFSLCGGVDGIFHLAALVSVQRSIDDPSLNHLVNIDGLFAILEAARTCGVPKIVLASSAALYGNDYLPPHKESLPSVPLSPYAVGKCLSELYAAVYTDLYGVQSVCLRFFNVYGPNQDPSSPYSGVISKFMDAISRDDEFTIFGDGEQTRDFVYVLDVVQALILSMEKSVSGVFNVGTGSSVSINQLARTIMEVSGKNVGIRYLDAREGEVRHSCSDISKICHDMGYMPKYSLREGISETYSWWREY